MSTYFANSTRPKRRPGLGSGLGPGRGRSIAQRLSNKAICVLAKKYLEAVLRENADSSLADFVIVGEQSRLEIRTNNSNILANTDSNILAKIQIDLRVSRLLESKKRLFESLPEMITFVNVCKVFSI